MSKSISTSKIGEEGLFMLLNRNGTIIANRDNYMISESLFGNQYEQMKKDTNQQICSLFHSEIRNIFFILV